jgi:hypothetical protein
MRIIQHDLPEKVDQRYARPRSTPLLGRQLLASIAALFAGGALIAMGPSCAWAQESDVPQPAATAETPPAEPPSASPSDALPPAAKEQPHDPRSITAKIARYAQRLVRIYDRNNNGQLEQAEWETMHGAPRQADLNGDGVIPVEELARHVAEYGRTRRIRLLPPQPGDLVELPPLLHPTTAASADAAAVQPTEAAAPKPSPAAETTATEPPAAPAPKKPPQRRDSKFYVAPERLPAGLPDWFLPRDRDGDGQLTISEFSPKSVPSELQQFKRLDHNGDGVLTAAECVVRAAKEKEAKEKAE